MKKTNWLLAGGFGLMAAVIYFASTAEYAFPGISAHLQVVWKGLDVEAVPQYPLMAVFAKALGSGNLLAPICGTIAVVTLFHLVAAFVGWRVSEEGLVGQRHRISLAAAIVAAAVFMLSPAVRAAATHLEPRLFDFTWALLAFALALPFFGAAKRLAWLFPIALGAMTAFGFCDSALFIALMPFYLALVWAVSSARGKKPYLPMFVFLFFFAVVTLVALTAFGVGVSDFLKRTSEEFGAYYGVRGWLFVAFFTTVPFLVALFSSKKSFGEKPGLVPWLFHGAMTFAAILVVATPLSPYALLSPYGILPVATSAFAAALAGYLVAFWWAYRTKPVGMVGGGVLAFVLAVTCVWNLFDFDGNAGAFADKVARKILDDLGDRRWFVTDGLLDNHLKLVAAEKGQPLNIISLARDTDEGYLDRLSELVKKEGIGGSKNGTLRLSLSLGVLPFVQDWFASDPTAAKEVAIFGAPDLWYSANLTPVPEFLFFGADEKRVPDWKNDWREFDTILAAPKGWGSFHDRKNVTDPVVRLRLNLRRHLGFVANNRGVWLQDKTRDNEAFDMYELVLTEIDHDNICAIFNEVGMIGQKHEKAMSKKKELERMLRDAVADKTRRYLLWRLGTYYGYIRNPDTFVRLGHAWARSGRPGDALSQIRRAIDFVPSDKRTILLNMMASLYASENDQKKSRAIYESVLAKNADDHDALIGLMRLSLLDGNSQKALEYLERAAKNTTDGKRAKIELAMVAMMKGELAKAKDLINQAVAFDDKDMQAMSLLAAITMQQLDQASSPKEKEALLKELTDGVMPRMEKRAKSEFDYYLMTTKGFVLLREGAEKRKEARDAFLAAAKTRPDITSTQDLVLGLDISLDDKENAETHAKEVLRRNRNAPLANYVMGSLALGRGKYTEAETYLRKAAEAPQPVALALNDLAEVLRRGKNFADAERYARQATEKAPGLYVAWETLGAILMDANRGLDEAEACIRKACQLSKDKKGNEADVRMLISLARVQVRRGDMQHAKVTIRKVRSRINELSAFEKQEFEEAVKSIK